MRRNSQDSNWASLFYCTVSDDFDTFAKAFGTAKYIAVVSNPTFHLSFALAAKTAVELSRTQRSRHRFRTRKITGEKQLHGRKNTPAATIDRLARA
jgi:pyruvate/2-oxoacid:ferredoxin oxidoreductase alpha subunit